MSDENNKIATAYHYTSDSHWAFTKAGYFSSRKCLEPYKRLVIIPNSSLPEWAHDMYTFAFLNEKRPESWVNNREFPCIWERVMKHVSHSDICKKILRFDITKEDEVYVIDWSYIERVRPELRRVEMFKASAFDRVTIEEAMGKYIDSRTPIKQYQGGHSLPELIIKNPISLDRIDEVEEI